MPFPPMDLKFLFMSMALLMVVQQIVPSSAIHICHEYNDVMKVNTKAGLIMANPEPAILPKLEECFCTMVPDKKTKFTFSVFELNSDNDLPDCQRTVDIYRDNEQETICLQKRSKTTFESEKILIKYSQKSDSNASIAISFLTVEDINMQVICNTNASKTTTVETTTESTTSKDNPNTEDVKIPTTISPAEEDSKVEIIVGITVPLAIILIFGLGFGYYMCRRMKIKEQQKVNDKIILFKHNSTLFNEMPRHFDSTNTITNDMPR